VIGDIFQPTHLLLLLAVVLLVLGPKRLPEMARSLGRGMRDFKDAISGESNPMHEFHQQPIESTAPSAATTRGSAQRPVATPAPAPDPVAEPAPIPDLNLGVEPEPVASQAPKAPAEGTD